MHRFTELLLASSSEWSSRSAIRRWAIAISQELDARELDIRFPTIKLGDPADAAHYPTIAVGGPTQGWLFLNDNWCFIENPFNPARDPTQNVIIGIAWAPLLDEPAKTVRWEGVFGFEYEGKDITVIDATKDVDTTCGGALLYKHTPMLITPADLAPFPRADEVHLRLQRLTSGNDPGLPPGLHHIAVVQVLK